MKTRLTRGEKWLFASPLLFLALAVVFWIWQKSVDYSIDLPTASEDISAEFSSDGKRLVTLFRNLKTKQYAGQVYDLEARIKVSELEVAPLVSDDASRPYYNPPSWSPDGRNIASGSFVTSDSAKTTQFSVWDASSGALKSEYPFSVSEISLGSYLGYSSDGKALVLDGTQSLALDASSGKRLKKFPIVEDRYLPYKSNEYELGLETVEEHKYKIKPDRVSGLRVLDAKTKRVVWAPKIGVYESHRWFRDILCVNDRYKMDQRDQPVGDAHLLLWNGRTRQQLPSPPLKPYAEASEFRFNLDQSSIAYFSRLERWVPNSRGNELKHISEIVVWDYRKNRVLWSAEVEDHLWRFEWSPKGKWLMAFLSTREGYKVYVFDTAGKLQYVRLLAQSFFYRWSSDEKQLVTVAGENDKSGYPDTRRLEIHRFDD